MNIIKNIVKKNDLIKSKQRVKDFAEVFTPEKEVKAMVDLVWDKFPKEKKLTATYLEPSCGTGNFLIEILNRKLSLCKNKQDMLTAYNSIYGIDIQEDNVLETQQRLLKMLPKEYNDSQPIIHEILKKNIIIGDFLTMFKAERI